MHGQTPSESLLASPRFLLSVLDSLPSRVCVLDSAGTIVAVNHAWRDFAQTVGRDPQGLAEGANYLSVCRAADQTTVDDGNEDGHAFGNLLAQVLAGTLPGFQFEYPCRSPEEKRWFLARVSCITDRSGAPVVVSHDDVTSLKLAQEALRDSDARWQDLAASLPGALFRLVHREHLGWRFVYVSPGVERLFGVTAAQVCAANSALTRRIVAEDRPAHDASIRAAVANHASWEHEYRIHGPDGKVKWIHALARPSQADGDLLAWTGVLTDVSERKRIEADLKASEQTYRTLFETVPQGVVYQDKEGRITAANPAALRILGLTLDQLQGRVSMDPRWQAVQEDGTLLPGEMHPAMVALRSGQPVVNQVMGVLNPGVGQVWLLVSATPLFAEGVLHEVYSSFEDITERVLLSRELRSQATTDFLTGLANRRSLMARLETEFQRVRRYPTRHCAVLALDLDLFKQVNDQWGHAVGDLTLKHVATLMRQVTREVDLLGRSGGEEFTLLLPDTDVQDALALAERLRACVEAEPVACQGQRLAVTVSIGVSELRADDANADAVLSRADRALYQAKQAGRNAVRAHDA